MKTLVVLTIFFFIAPFILASMVAKVVLSDATALINWLYPGTYDNQADVIDLT